MKRNVVKGLIFLVIVACIILIIAFCNKKPSSDSTPKPSQTTTPNGSGNVTPSPSGTSLVTEATPTQVANPTPTPGSTDQIIPTIESTQITKFDISGMADKNIVINLNYPKVILSQNPDVANKINSVFEDIKSTDIQAAGFYAQQSNEIAAEFSKSYTVKLLSNKYLSLLVQSQFKQGTTETEYLDYSYTFDLSTGNIVTAKQLALNETTFRGFIAAQILTQIYETDYMDSLCQDFERVINTYWDDTMWYFSETSFVVFFNPNTIGTPELGILTYEIPLSACEDYFK